jgi:hypothetical protein
MANKYMKKCLTFLVIKEMEIKMTLRCHLTSVKRAIVKITITNADRDAKGKKETLYTIGGNINWCNHYGNQYIMEVHQKLNIVL